MVSSQLFHFDRALSKWNELCRVESSVLFSLLCPLFCAFLFVFCFFFVRFFFRPFFLNLNRRGITQDATMISSRAERGPGSDLVWSRSDHLLEAGGDLLRNFPSSAFHFGSAFDRHPRKRRRIKLRPLEKDDELSVQAGLGRASRAPDKALGPIPSSHTAWRSRSHEIATAWKCCQGDRQA